MKSNVSKYLVGLGLVVAFAGAQAAPELIQNGSFEQQAVADGAAADVAYTAANSWGFGGWNQVTGSDPQIVNPSAGAPIQAPDGSQYALLTGYAHEIYQTISTNAGTSYTVSFSYIGQGNYGAGEGDPPSLISGSLSTPATTWTTFNYQFTADNSFTKVHFYGSNAGAFGVDKVSVTAVPEPESMAMLLAGLGVLGFMGRRRSNRG